jgi:hypothetical protein
MGDLGRDKLVDKYKDMGNHTYVRGTQFSVYGRQRHCSGSLNHYL